MSIELRCPACQKLLRVPDTAAGKKGKCPQCGTITPIPAESASTPTPVSVEKPSGGQAAPPKSPPAAAQQSGGANPFADSQTSGYGASADAANPYASPAAAYERKPAERPKHLTRRPVSFSEVFEHTWTIYGQSLGELILMSLAVIGMGLAAYVLFALSFGIFAFAAEGAGGADAALALGGLGLFVVMGLLFALAYLWILAGINLFMVRVARGDPRSVGDLFAGGRYLARFCGLALVAICIVGVVGAIAGVLLVVPAVLLAELGDGVRALTPLAILGVEAVMVVIAYVLMLTFLLAPYLIVDRDAGVWEALRGSAGFMKGNRLIAFLLFLVVGVICAMINCIPLVGPLFTFPFLALMTAVIYLMATGQPTAVSRRYGY